MGAGGGQGPTEEPRAELSRKGAGGRAIRVSHAGQRAAWGHDAHRAQRVPSACAGAGRTVQKVRPELGGPGVTARAACVPRQVSGAEVRGWWGTAGPRTQKGTEDPGASD